MECKLHHTTELAVCTTQLKNYKANKQKSWLAMRREMNERDPEVTQMIEFAAKTLKSYSDHTLKSKIDDCVCWIKMKVQRMDPGAGYENYNICRGQKGD